MDGPAHGQAGAAIEVLADLSTTAAQGARPSTAIPLEWFRWVPMSEELFQPSAAVASTSMSELVGRLMGSGQDLPTISIERGFADRLAGVDQVRAGPHSIRLGWLFVAGSFRDGGTVRRVFHPLVTLTVRIVRPPLTEQAFVVAAGDARLSPLMAPEQRRRLDRSVEFGGGALAGTNGVMVSPKLLARLPKLRRFASAAAAAAGLPADRLVPVHGSPDDLMEEPGLTIVAGYGLYVDQDTHDVSRPSTLRQWAHMDLGSPTAFHVVYGLTPSEAPPPGEDRAAHVEGPLVLSPSQREAVRRSRADPLTVISGPPGTGKSHTVAAIACDAVARGGRVLVAAKSTSTVDALIDLLERTPGPDPVIFGSSERRTALAGRLAAGRSAPQTAHVVDEAAARRDRAVAARDAVQASVVAHLADELAWSAVAQLHDEAWSVAPGLLDTDVDLDRVDRLLGEAAGGDGGWWTRRRRRRARAELVRLGRADQDVPLPALGEVVAISRARASARTLDAAGGLDLSASWEQLEQLDVDARRAIGAWLAVDARSPRRVNPSTLAAISALATALRSGRAARREQLTRLDTVALTTAFPLWIGTLDDIDDLLPARPASFDLVVLDEASSIDQPSAAAALLRARRAVVVGDPRQLRHVSFIGDDAIAGSVARHGLDGSAVAPRLDVRRNSIFDTAAGSAPVTTLGEHYRSDPHLVDFVARRLYDDSVTIATHSPATDHRDCVDAIRVDGRADGAGVVRAEIDRVLQELRAASARGARSVGVVTPFRAQADALERAALASFSTDQLVAMDLRVGTVHAFQGNERDLVLCSLGIVPDSSPAAWRFAQDPHLLTVFLTRARRQLVFIYSCDPPPDGLLAAYLAQSDVPPGPRAGPDRARPWARTVTEQLAAAGLRLAVDYPTGRHVIDAVLLDAPAPTALLAGVHPDGPSAHVDRHLALRRLGWRVEEVFESRWAERLALLAVRLRDEVGPRTSNPG